MTGGRGIAGSGTASAAACEVVLPYAIVHVMARSRGSSVAAPSSVASVRSRGAAAAWVPLTTTSGFSSRAGPARLAPRPLVAYRRRANSIRHCLYLDLRAKKGDENPRRVCSPAVESSSRRAALSPAPTRRSRGKGGCRREGGGWGVREWNAIMIETMAASAIELRGIVSLGCPQGRPL